jgi:hypothetical protein
VRFSDSGTRLRGVVVAGTQGRPERIDWNQPADELELPCEFQPNSSSEDNADQDRTVTSWRLFLLAGADMTAKDRWRFAGVVYEVDGEVGRHRVSGREHHVEAVVRRVAGG